MKQETNDYLDNYYKHLINADGFHIHHRPDEGDEHRELYIVIPERGVTVAVHTSGFLWFSGVYVSANQGLHDTNVQSEGIVDPSISIPDGETIPSNQKGGEDRKHLMNAEGFEIFHEVDEGDVGIYSLYIVIPERGVTVSITYHNLAGGVHVLAGQGLHDTHGHFDNGNLEMAINIPDGEKL